MPLDLLPPVIISKIICFLPMILDRLNLMAVNKELHSAALEWPDVIEMDMELAVEGWEGLYYRNQMTITETKLSVQGIELLGQYRRFPKLKKLSISSMNKYLVSMEIYKVDVDEMCSFLGRTLEELSLTRVSLERHFAAGFFGMPNLRKLEFRFNDDAENEWLTPELAIAMRHSTIEEACFALPAVDDDFNPFLVHSLPSNLRFLQLDVDDGDEENVTGHFDSLSALPKSLVCLHLDTGTTVLADMECVYTNDFTSLTSLEKLIITCLWPWCDDFATFVKLVENFVERYLPSSVGILCLCEPANYSRRRQLKNENSIEPFEVSRSEFECAAGGVARGREKHLTIEIFHTFGGDELSVDVHEKLRVNFGYYLDVGGSFL